MSIHIEKRLLRELITALENAADTFEDFEHTFRLLQRESLMKAAQIAGNSARDVLARYEDVIGDGSLILE